jgi:WD40 repeat protein
VWDATTGCTLARLEGHTSCVYSIAFSPDGMRIASGSLDHTVRVWDAIAGCALARLEGHLYSVTSVAFSPDGMRIASGSLDNTVRVWDPITGRTLAQFEDRSSLIMSITFSQDGTQIRSTDDSSQRIWYTSQVIPRSIMGSSNIDSNPTTRLSSLVLSLDRESGWLTTQHSPNSPIQRLCWIPPERRGRLWVSGNTAVLGNRSGIMTIMSISHA